MPEAIRQQADMNNGEQSHEYDNDQADDLQHVPIVAKALAQQSVYAVYYEEEEEPGGKLEEDVEGNGPVVVGKVVGGVAFA